MKKANTRTVMITMIMAGLLSLVACSSGPEVKQQNYAKLSDHRDFEYDFPTVWKGIESTLRNYVITDRDPSKVDAVEMKKLRERSLDTDWVYSRSSEKYHEYTINGTPRKIYLQTRSRYHIVAKTILGGVQVTIDPREEIERLNDDGSPAGYERADEPDRELASAMLDKINQSILSAAP
jgi:hypothetical protein